MSAERASAIAKLVDDAVVSVHRRTATTHGEEIRSELLKIGLGSAAHLLDMIEFLLADRFSSEIMRLRFRYHHPNDLAKAVDAWQSAGLVGADWKASPELRRFLQLALRRRGEVARDLWTDHEDEFPMVTKGARAVFENSDGSLVGKFRSLAVPDHEALAVHHLLTGVRYHRADAHASAWASAGLDRHEIGALTKAWHGEHVESPSSLADRGWFGLDGLTELGRQARDDIEVVTNQRAASAFAVFDEESWSRWFDSVRKLASGGAPQS
jgi:hypothetical protein